MTPSSPRVQRYAPGIADVHPRVRVFDPERLARIHALWDSLEDYPAGQIDQALQHLLTGLCELFDASCACWAGATREAQWADDDALCGWRTHGLRRVLAGRAIDGVVDARGFAARERSKERRGESAHDLGLARHLEQAGRFRAQRWSELVEADWFESDSFRTLYGHGIRDAVFVGFPMNERCESMVRVLRAAGQPAFSEQERDDIGYVLRGLKRFHRHLLLSFGLIDASSRLTNTERKVLQQLLTGRTEKEVAAELTLSYHTTHAHVASILRKFGAGNRPSLMALWLSPTGFIPL